ncbi:hypothetical protein ES707_19687 [subsurface metagenome]
MLFYHCHLVLNVRQKNLSTRSLSVNGIFHVCLVPQLDETRVWNENLVRLFRCTRLPLIGNNYGRQDRFGFAPALTAEFVVQSVVPVFYLTGRGWVALRRLNNHSGLRRTTNKEQYQ